MTTLAEYKKTPLAALKTLVAEHYTARESGSAAAPLSMGPLLHGLVWPDDEALCAPLAVPSDESIDEVCERYNLATDIVAGKYGRCAMVEAAFELESFVSPAAGVEFPDRDFARTSQVVSFTAMVGAGLYYRGTSDELTLDMTVMLNGLIHAKTDWADDLVSGVVAGRYGAHLQSKAAFALKEGMWDHHVDKFNSVVRTCITNGRLKLLAALADQGMPALLLQRGVGADHSDASTEAGRWLDVLSNYSSSGALTSFPRQVEAFRNSPAAVALADILVKHDPNHKTIDALKNTGGHAIIMESMMRSRIQSRDSGATANADSPPEAPLSLRRKRHL